ncbi:MAG: DJ-1/PfpI family protein [Actinomycetota bacterium]|nr:DJ-1/PfpI family protein [Actinomycetota bacterium]MDQ3899025.1 DJ-1/PfpI family protein [Actinomycetota bacterium]
MCTGSLVLAEAGLLEGYRATTHWAFQERLALYPGVEVVASRVVTDRNRMTWAGVTAGIDFVRTLIGQVAGPETAAGLQLMAEYDPQPPANLGSPDLAPPELVAAARQQFDQIAPDLVEFFAAKAGTQR